MTLPNAEEHLQTLPIPEGRLCPEWDGSDCYCTPPSPPDPGVKHWECDMCGRHWVFDMPHRTWNPEVIAAAFLFETEALEWAAAVAAMEAEDGR